MSDRPNRVAIARRRPGAVETATPTPTPTVPKPAAKEPAAPAIAAVPDPPARAQQPSAPRPARTKAPATESAGETFGGRSVQYAARLDGDLVAEWRARVQATGRPQSSAVAAAVEAFIALDEDDADQRILDVVQASANGPEKGPALPYSVRLPEDLLTRWKAMVDDLARPQSAAFTAALRAFLEHDAAGFDRQIRRSIKARKDAN